MAMLKRISFLLCCFSLLCCSDNIKRTDNDNFSYMEIKDCKIIDSDIKSIKLVFYKKNSNFKIKTNTWDDFTFKSFDNHETKGLNIRVNSDNISPIKDDMELVINDSYSYKFKEIKIEVDTFKKANIIGNDLYIYKSIKAKVNDSIMRFNEYDIHSGKTISLPFSLAKTIQSQ